jgi:hypothetical protein
MFVLSTGNARIGFLSLHAVLENLESVLNPTEAPSEGYDILHHFAVTAAHSHAYYSLLDSTDGSSYSTLLLFRVNLKMLS